jgi:hypothetical protein
MVYSKNVTSWLQLNLIIWRFDCDKLTLWRFEWHSCDYTLPSINLASTSVFYNICFLMSRSSQCPQIGLEAREEQHWWVVPSHIASVSGWQGFVSSIIKCQFVQMACSREYIYTKNCDRKKCSHKWTKYRDRLDRIKLGQILANVVISMIVNGNTALWYRTSVHCSWNDW